MAAVGLFVPVIFFGALQLCVLGKGYTKATKETSQ